MKKRILTIFKVTFSLGLIAWLYSRVEWTEFGVIVGGAQPWFLIPVFLILAGNLWISAWKWKLFLKADDLDQPVSQLFVSYWIGAFLSMFLPSNIGGDGYRIYTLGKETKEGVRSFTSVFAERFAGFVSLAFLGLFGALAGFAFIRSWTVIAVLGAFLGLFLVLLVLLLDARPVLWGLRITRLDRVGPIAKGFLKFTETFRKYGQNRRLMVSALGISLLFHIGYISAVYGYSLFLGLDCPFFWFVVFMPIIAIFEALPISFYGIGIRDSAYVYFFAQVGMPREHALALALTHLVLNVLLASIGGLLLIFRRNQTSARVVKGSN
jgi:glycosyltransferase 2 family protein